MALFLLGSALWGCGGGPVYPDTDVVEIPDFKLKTAEAKKDGGAMTGGTLEYEGQGDLQGIFRAYLASMKSHGWESVGDKIDATKAVGTFRKDTRTCTIELTSTTGPIKVSIKVQSVR